MRSRRSYQSRHCGRSWGSRGLSCRSFRDFQHLICSEQRIAEGNFVILTTTSLRYYSAFSMNILKERCMIATAQLSFLALVSSKCSFPTLYSKQEMSGCVMGRIMGWSLHPSLLLYSQLNVGNSFLLQCHMVMVVTLAYNFHSHMCSIFIFSSIFLYLFAALKEVFTFPRLFHVESMWNPWNPSGIPYGIHGMNVG